MAQFGEARTFRGWGRMASSSGLTPAWLGRGLLLTVVKSKIVISDITMWNFCKNFEKFTDAWLGENGFSISLKEVCIFLN